MKQYHVRLMTGSKGPSKVSLAITIGDRRAMVAFNKYQEDETAMDFPSKLLWLQDQVALDLKSKGFDVRQAAPPKRATKQVKPTRSDTPRKVSEPRKKTRKRKPKMETES